LLPIQISYFTQRHFIKFHECSCEKWNVSSIDGEKKLAGEENFILIIISRRKTKFTRSVAGAYIEVVSL